MAAMMAADIADLLLPVDDLDLRFFYLADDEGGDDRSEFPEGGGGLETVFGSYYSSDSDDDDGGHPPFDFDLCVPVLGRGLGFTGDRNPAIPMDRRPDDDPFLETLDPVPRVVVSDDMEDAGADYLGPGIGLLLGPAFDESDDEDAAAGGFPAHLGSLARLGVGGRDPSRSSLFVGDDMSLPAMYWESTGELDPPEEWEEVDGRVVERDVLSLMVGGGGGGGEGHSDRNDLDSDGETARNIEWEVLVAVNALGRDPSVEAVVDDDLELYLAEYRNDREYDVLFGQFLEQDGGASRGGLPAAKSAVASLPSIALTEEDAVGGNNICPVCKDEISLQEMAKQLPCLHHYHGECILPWLEIRNTCPVCRYPLPTGDPSRTAGGDRGNAVESHGRYDFEILPEEVDDPRMIFY